MTEIGGKPLLPIEKYLVSTLFVGLTFLGCSHQQNILSEPTGFFSGTMQIHAEDDLPVSLIVDESNECYFRGYVKGFNQNTNVYDVKLNQRICRDGHVLSVKGYVYDENAMPGIKTLSTGQHVKAVIVSIQNEGKSNE